MMNRLILFLSVLVHCSQVRGQDMEVFHRYNRELNMHSRNGMVVLGSWAASNLVLGAVGAATAPKGSMLFSFHLTNATWNVVNLGIALPAFIAAHKRMDKQYDIPSTFKAQRQQETLYLVNLAADGLYVGTGVFLQEFGSRYSTKRDQLLKGVGYALILQGGFLLVFDAVMYMVHRSHWKRNAGKLWEQLEFNGTSIRWNIPSKK